MLGYGRGHGIIMDKNYRIVKSVEPAGSSIAMDEHEFMLINGGKSALITIYHPKAYDLGAYGVDNGFGWVQESIFQEIDVETGGLIFEWRSLDHVDVSESYVEPMETEVSGDGRTKESPWDYFHINSVEKNPDGDYLISARHVSAVYKISGKDGHVMWRLNGLKSDFKLEDFQFSSQHDARFVSENSTHTVISLFDNASNGYNQTEDFSTGIIVEINHTTKIARCLKKWGAPDPMGGLLAKSQGNLQILPNGNVVMGWGNNVFLTEHTQEGTPVFYGWIALTGTMIYRVYKANWTAEPLTQPNLWSYSKEKNNMAFYVSWNGATEVTKWKFYGSHEKSGPFNPLTTVKKNGFETQYLYSGFKEWTYVEALHDNKVLSRSAVEKTWIPTPGLAKICDDWKCPMSHRMDQADEEDVRKQLEEEQLQLEAIREEERLKDERRAMAFKLGGGTCILLGLAMISRTSIRRTLLSFFAQDKYGKIQFWRGRYTRLNSV
jgi:hypothetical protein